MSTAAKLNQLSHAELQELASSLLQQIDEKNQELIHRQARIEALRHEIAVLHRIQFPRTSERLTNDGEPAQASLWGNDVDADLAAIEAELEALKLPLFDGHLSSFKENRKNA